MSEKIDILLVTATRTESKAVFDVFRDATRQEPKLVSIKGRIYHDLGIINSNRAFMVQSEMGTAGLGAAQQTVQKGLADLSPTAVIMIGIAFGINPKRQSIGDVLVSTRLMLYEPQRVSTEEGSAKLIPRGARPYASSHLVQRFRNAELYWDESKFKVHFGLILSGEKLVDNIDLLQQLREFEPEAIGGEMEGAGLYVACEDAKVDWILVKSICDWADGHKSRNKSKQQQLAAHNAASFVLHVLQAPLERDYVRELFTPYLSLMRKRIELQRRDAPSDPQRNILDFYIPTRGSIDPPPGQISLETSAMMLWDQLRPALLDGQPCIVLADFGMGKTWFLDYIFYQMAGDKDNYQLDGDKDYPGWIPLLYKLRGFHIPNDPWRLNDLFNNHAPKSIFENIREATWSNAIGSTAKDNYASLLQLYEAGRFLFMFDGLDEMSISARSEIDQVVTDIGRISMSAHRSPILITCRRSFFQDSAQERSLKERGFQVFYLWPWSTEDICSYLDKAWNQGLLNIPPKDALEQLRKVYDLRDLAGRALLSAMLVDQWKEIIPYDTIGNKPRDLVALYENHIEKALINWQAQRTLRLQKHEIIRYMEELAYLMFKLDSLDIHPDELDEYFEHTFGITGIGRYSEIAQSLVRDIKTNSLIVRSDGDNYSFCHTSIWEFFVARKLLRSLERKEWDVFTIVGRCPQYASIVQNFLMPVIRRQGKEGLVDAFFGAVRPSLGEG